MPELVDQGRAGHRPGRRAPGRRAPSTADASSRSGPTSTRRPGARCSTPAAASSAPALVDLHTHLREPGREEAETIETRQPGRRARRLHGRRGHAQHRRRPSTTPRSCEWCSTPGRKARCATCEPSAAITVGRQGEALAPMAELADARRAPLHRRRQRRAGRPPHAPGHGVRQRPRASTLAQHCEIEALAAGGHMHEGEWSSRLGIPGIPAEAEELMVHPRPRPRPR